jgi:hypothetical protein
MGEWFESRDGEEGDGVGEEEDDYTTSATACNMQKAATPRTRSLVCEHESCGIGLLWEGIGVQASTHLCSSALTGDQRVSIFMDH